MRKSKVVGNLNFVVCNNVHKEGMILMEYCKCIKQKKQDKIFC